MEDFFNQYTGYISNPHTKLQYTYSFQIFKNYLNLCNKDLDSVSTEDILNFAQWLKINYGQATIRVRVGNIKTFFKWLEE